MEVSNYDEALRLQNVLAAYDQFQFENKIKPDYCNASGVQVYDHSISDEELEEMSLDDRWVDIEDKEELKEMKDSLLSSGWTLVET